jgi:SAM-dependent methyltransferase
MTSPLTQELNSTEVKVGNHWSDFFATERAYVYWWNSKLTIRHINRLVSDTDSPVPSAGVNQLLLKRLAGRRLKLGVSVGCGLAYKEIRLLQLGVVDKFIVFDLSQEAVQRGAERADEAGLQNRIEFHKTDAFAFDFSSLEIDFVHWNNSLHHMFDANAAVKWSKELLVPGGVFYMDDYIGCSRFQFPQSIVEIVNELRNDLPCKYLKNQNGDCVGKFTVQDLDELIKSDPSEAADSQNILSSIAKYFPNADVIHTGGIVYLLALGDSIYSNFNEENEADVAILEQLLEKDKILCQERKLSLYAVALAEKI